MFSEGNLSKTGDASGGRRDDEKVFISLFCFGFFYNMGSLISGDTLPVFVWSVKFDR